MRQPQEDRPCIHVSLGTGVDPGLYRWVEVGAEEEGVPCSRLDGPGGSVAELAYEAAQSSRLNIGVGIGEGVVALHEQHMPPARPVLVFEFEADPACACRRMGANAARMVVHRPLLMAAVPPDPVENTVTQTFPAELDPNTLARLVKTVIRKVHERGIL